MKERQIILSTCTEHDGDDGTAYGAARVIRVEGGRFTGET